MVCNICAHGDDTGILREGIPNRKMAVGCEHLPEREGLREPSRKILRRFAIQPMPEPIRIRESMPNRKCRHNTIILGVAILVIQKDFNLVESIVYAISTAIGYSMALLIFSSIREQLALTKVPKAMQGVPIALLTAGILAMAFMGFSGIDQVFK